MTPIEHLIIGAGPTGLGAAIRLQELGCRDFLVLESNPHVGGLAASYTDTEGFTWDVGGHVLFSESRAFLQRIRSIMNGDLLEHEQRARIRMGSRWIDYPFQNHIDQLPQKEAQECLEGMIEARKTHPHPSPDLPFDAWMEAAFGNDICRLFMRPYNRKVWAVPLRTMASHWIGSRVSLPHLEDLKSQMGGDTPIRTWGPNSTFLYPLRGGAGDIFQRVGQRVQEHILTGHAAAEVDLNRKILRTSNGRRFQYTHLLNTSPLDRFVTTLAQPVNGLVRSAVDRLKHNGVAVIGVGTHRYRPGNATWMYFPDGKCPFYRVTNLHNYSPHMTPHNDTCMALLSEVSFSGHRPLPSSSLAERVLSGLKQAGLYAPSAQPLSTWERIEEYGYPIPSLERDRALATIHPFLEDKGVFSRGRFGGWKYEIGNMDHSFIQGMEWAERVIEGKEERMYARSLSQYDEDPTSTGTREV